jgi:hypothetical protein
MEPVQWSYEGEFNNSKNARLIELIWDIERDNKRHTLFLTNNQNSNAFVNVMFEFCTRQLGIA